MGKQQYYRDCYGTFHPIRPEVAEAMRQRGLPVYGEPRHTLWRFIARVVLYAWYASGLAALYVIWRAF